MTGTRIAAVIATAVLLATLAIGSAAGSDAGPHAPGAAKPIVIGFAIGQTGFMIPFDVEAGYNAWRVAIANQNKRGGLLGRPIKTVLADSKSDINQGSIAGQAVLSKGADFMVTSCDYNLGGGAARVANSNKKIVFSICAGDPKFGRQGIGPYAFTPSYTTPTEGAAVAEFARGRGWKHPFLLVDTSIDYNKSLCSYFKERWKLYGSSVSIAGEDTFTNSDTSVATQVSRLKATPDADFVFLCSYPPGGATAIKQIRSSGVNLPIVGGDSFDGTFWTKGIPKLSNFYAPVAGYVHGGDPRPAVNQFARDFKALHGKPPANAFSVWAYQGAQVLLKAIQTAQTLDSNKILSVLESTKNFSTITGPFRFTRTNHFNNSGTVTFIEYRNGQIRFVRTLKPKVVPRVKY